MCSVRARHATGYLSASGTCGYARRRPLDRAVQRHAPRHIEGRGGRVACTGSGACCSVCEFEQPVSTRRSPTAGGWQERRCCRWSSAGASGLHTCQHRRDTVRPWQTFTGTHGTTAASSGGRNHGGESPWYEQASTDSPSQVRCRRARSLHLRRQPRQAGARSTRPQRKNVYRRSSWPSTAKNRHRIFGTTSQAKIAGRRQQPNTPHDAWELVVQ